jgi:GNAT superfamily N-acetyltransferase
MKKKQQERAEPLSVYIGSDEYWTEHAGRFPQRGEPNSITYSRSADTGRLLAYDASGELAGMLFYYFADIPMPEEWEDSADRVLREEAGNFNVIVHRDKRRQGIGTKLLREAMRRWHVDLGKQAWTPDGSRLRDSIESLKSTSTKGENKWQKTRKE